jgi:NAD(P)-dependent dehydrogenase (short-subunit alcohol dehydrogenase family)
MKIAELFRVDGRAALVTGGASGIGFACAEVLAENGAHVAIIDRDTAKLDEAKKRLSNVSPDVLALQADVIDSAATVG